MNNKILIVAGDPNSINTEIIFKSYKKLKKSLKKNIYIIGNYNLIEKQFKILKYNIKLKRLRNIDQSVNNTDLKIIDLKLSFKDPFKVSKRNSIRYVVNSLNLAHEIAVNKKVKGIINCPINKKHLAQKKIGVTEYLAKKCKIKNNSEVMLIFNDRFAVAPLTTHIDIKQVSNKIGIKKILNKLKTIERWYKKKLKIKPKIGILGLNPHNAELFKSSEEKKVIIPAIKRLKKLGIKVNGPLVPDSLFISEYKKYNVVVGMYHDQVLAPFKAIYKFNAINITLGLKYFRASPDHGTAYNIIKKNKANAESLLNCISILNKFKK